MRNAIYGKNGELAKKIYFIPDRRVCEHSLEKSRVLKNVFLFNSTIC